MREAKCGMEGRGRCTRRDETGRASMICINGAKKGNEGEHRRSIAGQVGYDYKVSSSRSGEST